MKMDSLNGQFYIFTDRNTNVSLFYEFSMTTIGGPIIIIERDEQDQVLIADLFKELNHRNELVFFRDGNNAFEYLKHQDVYPFLILSDVNIPPAEAFELRTKIQSTEGVSQKGLPYLFYFDRNNKKIYI